MPTYVYQCETCDAVEEIVQKFEDFDKIKVIYCAECWQVDGIKSPMKRLIGSPAVVFKGPGFYSTDNPKQEKIQKKVRKEEWR